MEIVFTESEIPENESMQVVWSPDMPESLTEEEVNQYKFARDSLIKEIQNATGRKLVVVTV